MNYADANFLLCAYLTTRRKAIVASLFESIRLGAVAPLPVSWLCRMEVFNAIEFSRFLGKSGEHPHITPEQAALTIADFKDDLNSGTIICPMDISIAKVESMFENLALRHTAAHGFRTYDLLHVASALTLNCREFWSFDARASKLAKLEGLKVLPVYA